METRRLVPCIDQFLGDCDYRRVEERKLTGEMLEIIPALQTKGADTTPGVQACRGRV